MNTQDKSQIVASESILTNSDDKGTKLGTGLDSELNSKFAFLNSVGTFLGINSLVTRIIAWKLWALFCLLILGFSICGYTIADRNGLVVGFFSSLGIISLIIFYDEWRLLNQFPSEEIEGSDAWRLNSLTNRLAKSLAVKPAKIREIEHDGVFFLSAGLFSSRHKIFVSSGIIGKLTDEEISAILSLELMRAHRGHTQAATAAVAMADMVLVVLGTLDAVFLLKFFIPDRLNRTFLGPFTWAGTPFITLFLRLAVKREKRFEADRLTAAKFQNGAALAKALWKLDSYAKTLPIDVSLAEAALFTADPLVRLNWNTWTSLFPPVQRRISKINPEYRP